MANEENSDGSDGIPDGTAAFLKQIVAKLKDPAALYSLALFILAAPLGYAMDDYVLAYWMALAFSLPVLGLRAYQISVQGRNEAHKLDLDNKAKLASIESSHQLKMAKLRLKSLPTSTSQITSVPSSPSQPALGLPQAVPRLAPPASHQSTPRSPRKGRRSNDPVIKGS